MDAIPRNPSYSASFSPLIFLLHYPVLISLYLWLNMCFSKDADSVPPPSNHPGPTGAGPRQVTICSDLWAPQNKVWHCFHCFPVYLPWSGGTRCHDPPVGIFELSVLNLGKPLSLFIHHLNILSFLPSERSHYFFLFFSFPLIWGILFFSVLPLYNRHIVLYLLIA